MTLQIIEMSVLLLLSAFFSGSETAFFSLKDKEIRLLKRKSASGGLSARAATALAANPRRLLFAVLFGNMVVNILFFAVSCKIGLELAQQHGSDYYTLMVGAVSLAAVIILGEVTPKSVAYHIPVQWAIFSALPLIALRKALAPVELIAHRFSPPRTEVKDDSEDDFKREELKEMVNSVGLHSGFDPRLRRLLKEIIDFGGIAVHEIMVPRVDVVACSAEATIEELAALVEEKKTKNIPVFHKTRDEIVGIVSAKDIFTGKADTVEGLIRPVNFVPENKSVESLLGDFRHGGKTFAVVVNEYGGTEGIVTLEDIVEEIVGEIDDEFDTVKSEVRRLSDKSWLVNAGYSLRDFCEKFNLEAEREHADTVGGFVAALIGEIPRVGSEARYGNLKMTLRCARKHRPVTFLVERIEEERQ